ncbi:hypothetical protein [Flavobacterium sp.]|uniref:hypothetical protein n=1 Tax=Flavobacterium sp. TaxID=239 RepID=UPI0040338FF8
MDNEKPTRKNRPGQGRPFKMKIWVEALAKVIEERKIAFLTQEELVFLVNKEIPEKDCHITTRTLRNWAAGKTDPKDNEVAEEFLDLFKTALIEQKLNIVDNILAGGDKNWYRLGWLAERVYSDQFSLKKITEIQHTSNQPIIQIQAADSKQAQLIDSIINVDFVEVPKKVIELTNDNKEGDYGF